ncbi:MAG: UvrD-helicase domain-containing protein [Clostridiales bacterium]|nr:UvrD-helicase domain-containing protein [Clostridiales bacterium]
MRDWNEGQLRGITVRGENILVSASAGTGKTAVLVERLIRRLTDPADPLDMDRFVFVTFTNAAAQEMLHRVRQGIEEKISEAPRDRRLARQRQLLGQAAISTLHGFCLELIRRHYKELGIDPGSRVLSEGEQFLLRNETLGEYLEERYEANDPGFAALTSAYGGDKTDGPLRDLIIRTLDFASAQPDPEVWLEESVGLYQGEGGADRLAALLAIYATENLRSLAAELERGVALSRRLPALKKYEDCLAEDRDKLLALSGIGPWSKLAEALEGAKGLFARLPVVQTKAALGEEPEAHESRLLLQSRIKKLREKCKKRFLDQRGGLIGETMENLAYEVSEMAPVMLALAAVTAGFYRSFEKVKRERAVLDFGDIEHYAYRLLSDGQGKASGLAAALRERYEEILVDEYQDINPVQEAILQALRGRSLVMVGDVKQSIYGFRRAAPGLFLEKYDRYRSGGGGVLERLNESYRGTEWIVGGINQVFNYCMTKESCGLDYRDGGELISKVNTPEEGRPPTDADAGRGALELHVIDPSGDGSQAEVFGAGGGGEPGAEGEETPNTERGFGSGAEPDDVSYGAWGEDPESARAAGSGEVDGPMPEPGALQTEAEFCAWRIEELMKEFIWDRSMNEGKGGLREMSYNDVAILLPAMKGVADAFVKALQARDIPVYADVGGGYFQAQEVLTALSFLKVLDNPRQDIPLAALMLSPAFGFTPEGLGRIKAAYGMGGGRGQSGGLYKALVFAGAGKSLPEGRELRVFLRKLKDYRLYARHASVAEVLTRFYEDTGFLTISSAMAGGVQRRANLLALIQRAEEFEDTGLQGLYQFIKYMEALEKEGMDLDPAPVIGEGEDVVRVMSIHKSKGLEFPVVMLATAGRRFNMRDSQRDLLLHDAWGMSGRIIIPELRVKYPGAYHMLAAAGIRREAVAEEMRKLYVALTRAQQRVVVVTADRKGEQRIRAWEEEEAGTPSSSPTAVSFMDWLGPAVFGRGQDNYWVGKYWPEGQVFAPRLFKEDEKRLWQTILTLPEAGGESPWGFVGRQLAWRYPWARTGELSAKLSVTQARGRLYPDEDPEAGRAVYAGPQEIYAPRMEGPRFLQGKSTLSPGEKGTLLHKVLARIQPAEAWREMEALRNTDTNPGASAARAAGAEPGEEGKAAAGRAAALYLDGLIQKLIEEEFLTRDEGASADKRLLAPFILSSLFRRMAQADARGECRREASFFMSVPAARVYESEQGGALDAGDSVVIQGIIDVFFMEEGRLILADYKSDRIKPGEEGELLRRYRGQLLLYAEGLEAFTGKKADEMMLYSLALGKEIPL